MQEDFNDEEVGDNTMLNSIVIFAQDPNVCFQPFQEMSAHQSVCNKV